MFAGTWTLESAEAVVDTETVPGHRSTLECVIALIQHCLIQREPTPDGPTSYRMLETIRQFAKGLLDVRYDLEEVHRRHMERIFDLAQLAEVAQYTNDGVTVFAQLRIHLADIPHALTWLEQRGEIDKVIVTVSGLRTFWGMQGHIFEGRPWLDRAIAHGRMWESPILGSALIALSTTIHMQGNESLAWTYANEGLRLLRHHDSVMAQELHSPLAA